MGDKGVGKKEIEEGMDKRIVEGKVKEEIEDEKIL